MALEVTLRIAAVALLVLLALVVRRHRACSTPMQRNDLKELFSGAGLELFVLVIGAVATIAATIIAWL